MRFLLNVYLILSIGLAFSQQPAPIQLIEQQPHLQDTILRIRTGVPGSPGTSSPDKLSGSGNDICSEAITLTVGNAFTCGNTSTNAAGSAFPNACMTTSGSGIQQFRTDWYCFNSGNNKTLALVMNSVTNTTSFNPGIAVFGPYASCAAGCSASMSGPLCDNVQTFPTDSIKILENLSPNAYYLIAIVERRNNPDISGGRSFSYCISVQPTNLDDCEVPASGCPPTCGQLCVYGQSTVPDPNDVVANCIEQEFSHRIQGSTIASPSDTVEFCYNFQVESGCTVSFSTVVSVSGCVGPGNIGAPSWRIYDASTCSVLSSGSSIPIAASVSTAGNYIFCFKYSAACVYHFGTWIFGYGTCVIVNPVLPVELSDFDVSEQEQENILTWTTLSEFNNQYFDVELSQDGITYNKIGTVNSLAADGNSQEKLDYYFTDRQPISGISYYRLKQTDLDGQYSYSPIAISNRGGSTFRFIGNIIQSISGNPAITFEDNKESRIHISVSDLTGKTIYEGNFRSINGINTYTLPLKSLGKGVYIIRLLKNSNQFITSKFTRS